MREKERLHWGVVEGGEQAAEGQTSGRSKPRCLGLPNWVECDEWIEEDDEENEEKGGLL